MGSLLGSKSQLVRNNLDFGVTPATSTRSKAATVSFLRAALSATVHAKSAGGSSGGGAVIAAIIARSRKASTWDCTATGWRKWLAFCEADGINPFLADEAAVLRYLGWLYSDNRVSGATLKHYLSHLRLTYDDHGLRPPPSTTLVRHAVDAFQAADADRKAALAPASERTGLPASVARKIFAAAIRSPDLSFVRAATAVITAYIFFNRGTAGVSLPAAAIKITYNEVALYTTLRKNQGEVPYTLQYRRNREFTASPIDLLLKYSRLRQATGTAAKGFWHLPGTPRFFARAPTMTAWLQLCLRHAGCSPPPGARWTSHSLRIGAASEAAGLNVPVYRIKAWGDWNQTSTVFEKSYFDPRMQTSPDSSFFFGHLLAPNLG